MTTPVAPSDPTSDPVVVTPSSISASSLANALLSDMLFLLEDDTTLGVGDSSLYMCALALERLPLSPRNEFCKASLRCAAMISAVLAELISSVPAA